MSKVWRNIVLRANAAGAPSAAGASDSAERERSAMSEPIPTRAKCIHGTKYGNHCFSCEGQSSFAAPALFCGNLEWHKGTEVGTAGKSKEGWPLWRDGDTLLAIVETNSGRETSVVHISCDEDYFSVEDSNGDIWGWSIEDIEWWALLDERNMPQNNSSVQ